jgi:CubicO group peptidase (beta-lactamase class C family)
MAPFFDLASLAKPLVTAPLALDYLDPDMDRREQLGFTARLEPLTVRQLLSHSSGLPPWLPYTGEPLPVQLVRGFRAGSHPLLREAVVGQSTYSDLNFRMLGELLELETGRPFMALGAESSGLSPAPWNVKPTSVPDGPDAEAWRIAEPLVPVPERLPTLPHDANARAGMRGHAGFGASPEQLRICLERWISKGFPQRMAQDTAKAQDGSCWGLGLQRSLSGTSRLGQLLAKIPGTFKGIRLLVSESTELSPGLPMEGPPEAPTEWWMHFGYTGPALFIRPQDGACICLLLHRRGPAGELLDASQVHARRWSMLNAWISGL